MIIVFQDRVVTSQVFSPSIFQVLADWSLKEFDQMLGSLKKVLILEEICQIPGAEVRDKLVLSAEFNDFIDDSVIVSLECN